MKVIFNAQKLSIIKSCDNCKHRLQINNDQLCTKFKFEIYNEYIDTSIARFPDFDLCGIEGKYYESKKIDYSNLLLNYNNMNIVTESGFWKSFQDKHYHSETIKCLFESLADLNKIDTSNTSGEINFIDEWYYNWNIINNEIHISNIYWKKL